MTWKMLAASEFANYAERWQALNLESGNTPLLEPDFVHASLAAFATGKELLAVYTRDAQVQAMAIVTPRGARSWETFQPSQAPIGMWLQRPALDTAALIADLLRALPGFALVLGLTQRDPDLAPRPADGGAVRTLDYIRTARISIAGSFDDYWNARGKNLRTNMKKQRAKLLKDGVQVRMQVSRAPQEMAQAVADYGKLESAGWKAEGGTAIHPDNEQGLFYRTMLEAFARRGAACVYRYWFDQQLVAMDFCIEGNGSIIILKTTYDETVPNSLSPTLLMREEATREIFDGGRYTRLEYYGKVMEWHTRWSDEIRTMYHVTGYRWSALPGLRKLAQPLGQLRARLRAAPR